jgi:hypothetical protein
VEVIITMRETETKLPPPASSTTTATRTSSIATDKTPILDWNEITKSKKIVRTADNVLCGYIIAEYNDNIIILEGDYVSHEHMIPKSKVDSYNGKELHLDIPYSKLWMFDF